MTVALRVINGGGLPEIPAQLRQPGPPDRAEQAARDEWVRNTVAQILDAVRRPELCDRYGVHLPPTDGGCTCPRCGEPINTPLPEIASAA